MGREGGLRSDGIDTDSTFAVLLGGCFGHTDDGVLLNHEISAPSQPPNNHGIAMPTEDYTIKTRGDTDK